MSNRAEQAAKGIYKDGIELFGRRDKNDNLIIHPEIMVGILRNACQKGYEQAEKDTIERAIAWLKKNANKYIVDLTPTYPDAPANIIVGGMCWEHLKDYLQNE